MPDVAFGVGRVVIKIICVCGARPNFMKIAPLMRAFEAKRSFDTLLVHTGQHYDENMSRLFFDELGIPKPDVNLEVGSGSHAYQTAEIMKRFEPVVLEHKPDYVLVVGDVNSTIACGLVAVKLGVKLIHVEAGLRSFDLTMPEEINRMLTDRISDLLFVTEQSGVDNLLKEGINSEKVHLVGNVMIDTLRYNKEKAEKSDVLNRLGLTKKQYCVITLHRPSNVDDTSMFSEIISAFEEIQNEMKLVFPIHPRTRNNIKGTALGKRMDNMRNLLMLDPLGYLDFLCLMSNAALVMTDSGGIQAETTIINVPCITLRETTECPITLSEGTNRLVILTTDNILKAYRQLRGINFNVSSKLPRLWDGQAARRIAEIIQRCYTVAEV
jgi:UDP-N-acetylglucosamine 2-epimerase (non-hydrolysing)